jgi:nucleoside-diphosphate-sugar epimerase
MMASTDTDPGRTVLVTDGTGYLGGWVVAWLLARGYRVRATIRLFPGGRNNREWGRAHRREHLVKPHRQSGRHLRQVEIPRRARRLALRGGQRSVLTTILPGWIMGPAIDHAAAGSSAAMFRQMLAGKMPALPNVGGLIVDVRDIAHLHIQALIAPQVAGPLLLAVGEFRTSPLA